MLNSSVLIKHLIQKIILHLLNAKQLHTSFRALQITLAFIYYSKFNASLAEDFLGAIAYVCGDTSYVSQ